MVSIKEAFKSSTKKLGFEIKRFPQPYRVGENLVQDVQNISIRKKFAISKVFDVGANRGDFSRDALNAFSGASIYAFEPHPKTYHDLIRNVQDNRFQAFQIALSDRNGEAKFFDYGGTGHINSLVENARFAVRFQKVAEEISVSSETLDHFCERNALEAISLLKVDTEGNDFRVLKGSERMLRENRIKFIYFEFNDFLPKSDVDGGSLLEIAQFLSTYGFSFVATYTDYIVTEGSYFAVANCLMYNDS